MTPFRLGHDEYQHELPWRLLQNGSVTLYWRRASRRRHCGAGAARLRRPSLRLQFVGEVSESAMLADPCSGLALPFETLANFDALDDALTDMDLGETGRLAIVLYAFDGGSERDDILVHVLAEASRWWMLFGRLVAILLQTNDALYQSPRDLGATRAWWNPREFTPADRNIDHA